MKTDIEGGRGDCLKRGTWTFCRFKGKGGLARKKGVVFLRGVDTSMHTMIQLFIFSHVFCLVKCFYCYSNF